jgi:cytochrome c-type biogenesis protein CcmF
MNNIQYVGEHLLLKYLGESFIWGAIIFSLFSFISYLAFNVQKKNVYRSLARTSYILHLLSVVGAGVILYILLFGLHYEFAYVWSHTASYLDTKYIVAAFWAGQEGSFLLWVFFEALLGFMVLRSAKSFESYVMPVIAVGQFFLTTMVWGVKLGNFVIGQSPFMLMREQTANLDVPFFKDPNYLKQIIDGNGINPLLENIWMVTHPPLLFVGYSAAIIPFAFVIAALWKGDFQSWIKPAMPWTIFSIITLGGGILLGGAWAYESLTFGGFWAWDPVENASLMPWLFIVAGFHMMILNKKRNHSYALSFLFLILGFVFVIYASYLTRSGVLGETSAHAFGNNGLSAQMVVIIALTVLFSLYLYFRNVKNFPYSVNDKFFSREFWMYLGSLVLVLSSFQIFATTSVPVFNKILGTNIAPPTDVVAFYNKWQLPFAIIIMLMIGGSLVLRYGQNNEKSLLKRFWIILGITNVLFFAEVFIFSVNQWALLVFLLFINFAIVAAASVLFTGKWTRLKLGNSLSHLGFSLFMLGVLVAFSNAEVITRNSDGYMLGDEQANRENQVLFLDKPTQLGDYWVVYDSLTQEKNYLHYTVNFYKDEALKDLAFTIRPDININSRMGNVYNPATHHTFSKDVFTYITYADLQKDFSGKKFSELIDNQEVSRGDTLDTEVGLLIFKDMRVVGGMQDSIDINNLTIAADFVLETQDGPVSLTPMFVVENGAKKTRDAVWDEAGYILRFESISAKPGSISISFLSERLEFIVIKTTIFPWISFLLIGGFIMFGGLFISWFRMWRESRLA